MVGKRKPSSGAPRSSRNADDIKRRKQARKYDVKEAYTYSSEEEEQDDEEEEVTRALGGQHVGGNDDEDEEEEVQDEAAEREEDDDDEGDEDEEREEEEGDDEDLDSSGEEEDEEGEEAGSNDDDVNNGEAEKGEVGEEDKEEEDGEDGEEEGEEEEPSSGPSFGSVLDGLLQSSVPAEKAPILLNKAKTKKLIDPELKKKKELLKKKKDKMALLAKDHIVPQFDDNEKRLLKTATKGVVTLFNIVMKQQREIAKAEEDGNDTLKAKDKKVEALSKTGFMDLLKKSTQSKTSSATAGTEGASSAEPGLSAVPLRTKVAGRTPVLTVSRDKESTGSREKKEKRETIDTSQRKKNGQKQQQQQQQQQGGKGWAALQDEFMMGSAKLKDWDKQMDSGDDEDAAAFDEDDE